MSDGGAPRDLPYRALFATTVVLAACGAILWGVTDGLRVWTAESARRLAVAERPVRMPAVALEDQFGRAFRLDELRGQATLVDFVYTGCRTLCTSLGLRFKMLQDELPARGVKATLVSVSFDPDRDTTAALRTYAARHGADGEHWRVARVADSAGLDGLLRAFGVVAIPDGTGEFQHNAAIHVVDRTARLVRILDIEASTAEVVTAIDDPIDHQ